MNAIDALRARVGRVLAAYICLHVPLVIALAWLVQGSIGGWWLPGIAAALAIASVLSLFLTQGLAQRLFLSVAMVLMIGVLVATLDGHPWQIDCFVVIRKHPNLYADISANFYRPWSYYNALRHATEWGVLHKLLLGSDFPIATPQETMDALWRVNDVIEGTKLPRVPEEELEKILHRDSFALLGLE